MKSPIIFRVFKNNQIHFVKQFVDKDQIVFGYSGDAGAEVDVDLDSKEISAIHCLVEKRGPQYYVCDLGSAQGTFKNGQSILDEPLSSGDEFLIGPFKVVFFVGVPKPIHTATSSSEIIIPPIDSVKPTTPSTEEKSEVIEVERKPVELVRNPGPLVGRPSVTLKKPAAESANAAKPAIQTAFVGQRHARAQQFIKSKKIKGQGTFAPGSDSQNLSDVIKPGQGSVVEVIVSWKERIINTHHFVPVGQFKAGPAQSIQIPEGATPKDWVLLDCTQGVTIRLTSEMKCEIHRSENIIKLSDTTYRLQQNEVVFIQLANGMQLAIRFAPKTALVPLDSPLIFSSSEFTGILAALIIAMITSIIVTVLTPKDQVKEEEDVQRIAQVIFNKPQVPVVPATPPPVETPPKEQVKQPPKPPEPPKKIVESDKAQEVKQRGDPKKDDAKAQAAQKAGRANEVKPKDSKLKTKMFTSTKQGAQVKTGDKTAANAQSKEPDPTNQGLLSAFGTGGARSKLDKAYSGTGEALGAGEKATGASGFNENRAGDDLGSKFKDTGAGGKGTATQGIAGIGTKGRGTGMSAYGSGTGFGEKDQVAIQAGGAEEEFVGTIDREAVRRVVRSAINSFKACYEREYKKDTKLEGKVVIAWEIHEKGVAKNARVVSAKSTIGNAAVEDCVRSRMLTLRFPEPPQGTMAEVMFPFVFQGQR